MKIIRFSIVYGALMGILLLACQSNISPNNVFKKKENEQNYLSIGGPFFKPIGIASISSDQVKGKSHYQIKKLSKQNKIIEHIYPDGRVESSKLYVSDNTSGLKIYNTSSFNVTEETTLFDSDNETYKIMALNGSRQLKGCYSKKVVFNENDDSYKYTCLNRDKRTMADTNGIATMIEFYDKIGLNTKTMYLDVTEQPINSSDGYNMIVNEYNNSGNLLRKTYLDTNNKPVINKSEGCAAWDYKYLSSNLKESSTCLDVGFRPVADHEGITTYFYEYDQNGCIISEKYLNNNDIPSNTPQGISKIKYLVGNKCEALETTSWDINEKPIINPKWNSHKILSSYNEEGWETSKKFFDENNIQIKGGGCKVYEYRYKYDNKGNIIEYSFWDLKNKLMFCLGNSRNWKFGTREYNQQGLPVKRQDWSDPGILRKSGWHTEETQYDSNDCRIEEHQYGKPEYIAIYQNDSDCKVREIKHLNGKREPFDLPIDYVNFDDPKTSYHRVELVYDEKGKHIQDIYYKKDGKKIATVDCTIKKCFR